MITRRAWLRGAALAGAGASLLPRSAAGAQEAEKQPAEPSAGAHAPHQHGTATAPAVANGPAHAHAAPRRAPVAGPPPSARFRGEEKNGPATPAEAARRRRELGYLPVTTPGGRTLPHRLRDGWKEFRLVAEPLRQEFAPGMTVNVWGYNGSTPGPTLEAVEGDRVRIFVTNRLPEPTSIHWHGILLPNGMDGVVGLLQPAIQSGETFVYEFTLRQWGTFMYHPHADETLQMAMGLMGFLVVHPRHPEALDLPPVDRDFCLFPHMWFVEPGSATPDPAVMLDFNTFTFNGRAFPGTVPMVVGHRDRVRVRLANVSMTSHPIHFHGASAWVTQTDGGPIPRGAWWPETTINVAPGTTRAFEFEANLEGDWPLHCHKSHHAMNAMGHDLPNLLGVDTSGVGEAIAALVPGYMTMGTTGMSEHAAMAGMMPGVVNTLPMMAGEGPFGAIEMGGMFTLFKVRRDLKTYADPGWFAHPAGTIARRVDEAEESLPPT